MLNREFYEIYKHQRCINIIYIKKKKYYSNLAKIRTLRKFDRDEDRILRAYHGLFLFFLFIPPLVELSMAGDVRFVEQSSSFCPSLRIYLKRISLHALFYFLNFRPVRFL